MSNVYYTSQCMIHIVSVRCACDLVHDFEFELRVQFNLKCHHDQIYHSGVIIIIIRCYWKAKSRNGIHRTIVIENRSEHVSRSFSLSLFPLSLFSLRVKQRCAYNCMHKIVGGRERDVANVKRGKGTENKETVPKKYKKTKSIKTTIPLSRTHCHRLRPIHASELMYIRVHLSIQAPSMETLERQSNVFGTNQ